MPKVIRNFRERLQDMKRYNVGDEYESTDDARVQYLTEQGFLDAGEGAGGSTTTGKKRQKKGAEADGDSDAQ